MQSTTTTIIIAIAFIASIAVGMIVVSNTAMAFDYAGLKAKIKAKIDVKIAKYKNLLNNIPAAAAAPPNYNFNYNGP